MKKYIYLRAWCRMLGSFPGFTECEVARATADHAPPTAIYRRDDGTWATFENIQRQDTKREVQAIVDEMTRGNRTELRSGVKVSAGHSPVFNGKEGD